MNDPTLNLLVDNLNEKAAGLFRQDGYEQALETAEQARALASGPNPKQPLYPRGVANSLIYIAGCHLNANTGTQALPLLRQAIAILDVEDDPRLRSVAYHAMGYVYFYKGSNRTALSYLRRSLALAKANRQTPEAIDALIGMIGYYLNNGQIAKSEIYLKEALTLARDHKNPFSDSTLQNAVAYSCLAKGDYVNAEAAAKKALALNPSPVRQSSYWDTLGTIYVQKGDLPAAEAAFKHAIEIHENTHTFIHLVESYINLADLQVRMGKYPAAEINLNKALKMAGKSDSTIYSQEIHRKLAELYDQTGKPEKALVEYRIYYEEKQKGEDKEVASKELNQKMANASRHANQPNDQSQLAYLAGTDPLTGLLNAQQLALAAEKGWKKQTDPLAIAVFRLNDAHRILLEHGSLALDRAIIAFVNLLLELTRPTDTLARIDEDTFAMLMRPATLQEARQLCARAERFGQHVTFATQAGPQQISICHAACQRGAEDADPPALLERALQSLPPAN